MKAFLALLCFVPILALAELPPSAYEKMQAAAPEYFQIEVLRVDVSPGEKPDDQQVHVVAMVTQVVRTATEAKPDEIINILYTVTEHPKGWVGPGGIPLLQEKQQTVAYLAKEETGDFKPVAGRMSFSNFQSAAVDSLDFRAREGRRLILAGVIANVFLSLVKILGGIFGRSHALIADGIESSLDILNSGMMWAAVKYAGRPPDEDHPYGHGKMESLAAVAGALILLLAGLSLGAHSVSEIVHLSQSASADDMPALFTLPILFATIFIKEFLYRWFHRRGGEIGSRAVQADALHHRSDAITSLAALVGISAALLGGPAWAQADDWAALFSCGLIAFNGLGMLRGAMGDILDKQESGEITEGILTLVRSVPGVTSVEKCRVRKSGLTRLADLHVRVNGNRTVREGHDIAHQVKDALLAAPLQLGDVTVHVEPEAET